MSSTVTFNRSDIFPIGTSVKLYPAGAGATAEKPAGPSTTEATIDATGKFEAEVAEAGRFVAWAEVGGESRRLTVDSRAFAGRGTLQERIASRRAANGVITG